MECGEVADAAFTETLTTEDADLDLSLIQPAAVFRRVVDGESSPEPFALAFAKGLYEG